MAGIVINDLRWLFREQPQPDYGIDAQVEVVTDDDRIYGLLGLQIRGGNSRFTRPKGDEGWIFRDSSDHLDYWLRYALPVLVVIVDNDGNAFWEEVTPRTVKETPKGFTMLIPRSQPFDITAREMLLKLAQRGQRLVDLVPDFLAVLPPNAITPLKRAAEVDPLAAARLADRLAAGRAAPDMTAATLIGVPPSWLTAGVSAAPSTVPLLVMGTPGIEKARRAAERAQVDQPVRVLHAGVRGHGEGQRGHDRGRDQRC